MTHVAVPKDVPGIVGLLMAYPDTARHLSGLAQSLLTKETETFSMAERETLASYVSYLNKCLYCSESHAAAADMLWGTKRAKAIWESSMDAPVSDRFRSLLNIAEKVQRDGKLVHAVDCLRARNLGATDEDIHDTVLIAAAFCMFNRYVDGLDTLQPPRGDAYYLEAGQNLAKHGYLRSQEP